MERPSPKSWWRTRTRRCSRGARAIRVARKPVGKIEGSLRLLHGQPPRLLLTERGVQALEVDDGEPHILAGGSQRLVPSDHFGSAAVRVARSRSPRRRSASGTL